MRRIAVATCVFAQAASAQPALGSGVYPPVVFAARPSAEDMARRYPPEAWQAQQEGRAVLCCLVQPDGRLACAAIAESPEGQGFGEAARLLSVRYRLTPASADEWRARGGLLRLPLSFRAFQRPIAAPPILEEPQCGAPRS